MSFVPADYWPPGPPSGGAATDQVARDAAAAAQATAAAAVSTGAELAALLASDPAAAAALDHRTALSLKDGRIAAKGDGVLLRGALTCSSGSAGFTIAGASLTSADVGKTLIGRNAVTGVLFATGVVASVLTATTGTLAANPAASIALGDVAYGSDDSAKLVAGAALARSLGKELYAPPGVYVIAAPF